MDFYIHKKTKSEWPVERYIPGLGLVKKMYPKENTNVLVGYGFFPTTLDELEQFFREAKPMLDDLRKEVLYYLERNELDFKVD